MDTVNGNEKNYNDGIDNGNGKVDDMNSGNNAVIKDDLIISDESWMDTSDVAATSNTAVESGVSDDMSKTGVTDNSGESDDTGKTGVTDNSGESDKSDKSDKPAKSKKSGKKIGIACGVAAAALAVVYGAGVWFTGERFFYGTTINNTDVSYMSADAAQDKLSEAANNYTLTLKFRDGVEEVLPCSDILYS